MLNLLVVLKLPSPSSQTWSRSCLSGIHKKEVKLYSKKHANHWLYPAFAHSHSCIIHLSSYAAKINVGRVAVLMAYCYRLVKTFVTEKVAGNNILFSFMCMVAGWLFKVFIRAKFYEWLRAQGGWVRMKQHSFSLNLFNGVDF